MDWNLRIKPEKLCSTLSILDSPVATGSYMKYILKEYLQSTDEKTLKLETMRVHAKNFFDFHCKRYPQQFSGDDNGIANYLKYNGHITYEEIKSSFVSPKQIPDNFSIHALLQEIDSNIYAYP